MNKEINEIIERHGYNLKLEVGNGLTRIEAKNIVENAIKEAIDYLHSCEKLKAIDITEVEDMPDPYWEEYIKGKQ